MPPGTVTLEKRDAVAYLRLDGLGRGNRISTEAIAGLEARCAALADADDVHCVVVSGAGDDFCAGWAADALAQEIATIARAFEPVASLPQPVIAALHGQTMSAGLELALACDLRIAATDARFALPETEHGLLPLAGGAARLARAVGRGAATELLLTGRTIDAAEALRIGLVSRVVPPEQLEAEAERVAAIIAGRGPIATRFAKEAVHRGLDLSMAEALRFETDLTIILQTTEDRAEGVQAFKEKRPPLFQGR